MMSSWVFFLHALMALAFVSERATALALTGEKGGIQPGEGERVQKPFGDCETFVIGEETTHQEFRNGSSLVFYPLSDSKTTLFLKISIGPNIYKVTVEGTMLILEKCDSKGDDCVEKEKGGRKTSQYIYPQHWNLVKAFVDTEKISIHVNSRLVMSMDSLEQTHLDTAYWTIASKETSDPAMEMPPKDYLAQFNCSNTVLAEIPDPKLRLDLDLDEDASEETTEENSILGSAAPRSSSDAEPKPSGDASEAPSYGGLIVGLVVGAIILLTVAVILYQVYKKRKSASHTMPPQINQTAQTKS